MFLRGSDGGHLILVLKITWSALAGMRREMASVSLKGTMILFSFSEHGNKSKQLRSSFVFHFFIFVNSFGDVLNVAQAGLKLNCVAKASIEPLS